MQRRCDVLIYAVPGDVASPLLREKFVTHVASEVSADRPRRGPLPIDMGSHVARIEIGEGTTLPRQSRALTISLHFLREGVKLRVTSDSGMSEATCLLEGVPDIYV